MGLTHDVLGVPLSVIVGRAPGAAGATLLAGKSLAAPPIVGRRSEWM